MLSYISHRYPLVERRLTRGDCITWLQRHDLPVPPKSACVFCPYHTRSAWGELKRQGGSDWAHAVYVDAQIGEARPPLPALRAPAPPAAPRGRRHSRD